MDKDKRRTFKPNSSLAIDQKRPFVHPFIHLSILSTHPIYSFLFLMSLFFILISPSLIVMSIFFILMSLLFILLTLFFILISLSPVFILFFYSSIHLFIYSSLNFRRAFPLFAAEEILRYIEDEFLIVGRIQSSLLN